jgi:hypothetical protein
MKLESNNETVEEVIYPQKRYQITKSINGTVLYVSIKGLGEKNEFEVFIFNRLTSIITEETTDGTNGINDNNNSSKSVSPISSFNLIILSFLFALNYF